MNFLKNLVVKSRHHDKPIITDVVYKENFKKKPVVIFCHGYKGYKDWGAWNLAALAFAKENLFFIKFNFSHNGGTIDEPIDFPDLDAFGKNNYSIELNDLKDVIDWGLNNSGFKEEMDSENITLIGHSRGGGIVSIQASENKKVKRLITWSGVSDFGARFPKGEQLSAWKNEGISYILNSRTHQKMPHLIQFYKNFKENEERLTIKNAIEVLNQPHLIIHGEQDKVVQPSEAKNLHQWNPKSVLIFVEDMNHPLGCTQPWDSESLPEYLEKVVTHSIKFILQDSFQN